MPSIIRATTTSGLQVAPDNSGSLQLQTNGTTAAVTIDTSQNVGIGTTSPSSQLAVQTTAGSSTGFLKFTDVTYGGDVRFGKNTGISNDAILGTWGANNTLFYTNSTERMRIDTSGNLLLGTTTSTGKFRIKQSADAYSGSIILENFGNTNYWGFVIGSDNNLYYGYNNTSRGVFNNSTGAYTTISDERLKENITALPNSLDKVLQLNPKNYVFIDDESKNIQSGLIAQEVLDIIPEVVSKPSGSNEYYGLNYSGFVPHLVKAIQEQQTIINDLKARIETLEAK